ncbi:MAG: DUF4097 family beta strand repeat-containing protein [Ruminococcus flavefaciens]
MSDKYYSEQEEIRTKAQKSSSGKVIIIGLVLFLIGLVLTTIGGFICHNTDMNKYYKTADFDNTFSVSDVKNISVDIDNCDIIFKKSLDKDIKVTARSVPEDYKAAVTGDTLTISVPKPKRTQISMTLFIDFDPRIEVALPEKDYEKLNVIGGVGDIDLSDLKFNDVVYNTGTGDNKINNLTCKNMEIINGVGDNEFTNITCESCKLTAGTGDLDIGNINVKNELRIESGVGDNEMTGAKLGGLYIETGTGDTDFAGTVNGDIYVEAGTGDIDIALTNPESDFASNGKYTMTIEKGVGEKNITYNN